MQTVEATGHTFVTTEQNGASVEACSVCGERQSSSTSESKTEAVEDTKTASINALASMLGCQSVIASASVLTLVTLAAGVVICKKKKD